MPANKKERDPIPENFETDEELDEFWSTHSTADYADLFQEVHFNINLEPPESVPLEPNLARELHKRADQRNIPFVEFVNRILKEKLQEAA